MKYLLVLALAFVNDCALAASTSFKSFNQNQFTTNGNVVSLRFLTNNAGTIQASSTVMDGASAVAFSLNTSNTLSTAGSRLISYQNHGTNVGGLTSEGGVIIGRSGSPLDTRWSFFSYHDLSFGEQAQNRFDIGSQDSQDFNYFSYATLISNADVTDAYQTLTLEAMGSDPSTDSAIYLQAKATQGPSLTFANASRNTMNFRPRVASGTAMYVFDSDVTHSGGNLVEVNNNTTNKFTIDYLGNVTAKAFISTDALEQEAYSAGTVYSLTATPALVDFGTTDPTITVANAGTYMIYWGANVKYNAATFAGNQSYTVKIRRTNNTAADISNATITQTTRVITTITDNAGLIGGKPVKYVAAAGDVLEVWGSLSATPAAGSVDVTDAWVVITRIQ